VDSKKFFSVKLIFCIFNGKNIIVGKCHIYLILNYYIIKIYCIYFYLIRKYPYLIDLLSLILIYVKNGLLHIICYLFDKIFYFNLFLHNKI